MTSVRNIQRLLNDDLKAWQELPLTIFVSPETSGKFYATVGHYEFHSLEDLKDKLALFPAGTKFYLAARADDSTTNSQKSLSELRSFLPAHNLGIAGEKLVPNQ
jgi:hypothetical protein